MEPLRVWFHEIKPCTSEGSSIVDVLPTAQGAVLLVTMIWGHHWHVLVLRRGDQGC